MFLVLKIHRCLELIQVVAVCSVEFQLVYSFSSATLSCTEDVSILTDPTSAQSPHS